LKGRVKVGREGARPRASYAIHREVVEHLKEGEMMRDEFPFTSAQHDIEEACNWLAELLLPKDDERRESLERGGGLAEIQETSSKKWPKCLSHKCFSTAEMRA